MLPWMRQRLMIAAVVVLGAACWLAVGRMLLASDGASGVSLFTARSGPVMAALALAMVAVPVLVAGLIVSSSGHTLAGVFAVTFSLGVLAGWGGPIDGWMRRASLPSDFSRLMIEVGLWQIGIVVMLVVIQRLRSSLRPRLPSMLVVEHLGSHTQLQFPDGRAIGAGLLAAVVSGSMAFVLLRSTSTGQVIGGLLIAFVVGGMAAQMIFPQDNPVGILLSPAVVALLAYGYMMMNFFTQDQVLHAWYTGKIPGPSLVLPIYYASFAVAGAAMGVGLGQSLSHGSREAATA